MKRTKKMLAMFLALVMAFTTLVMPAMAANEDEDEGIVPYGALINCDRCGAVVEVDMSKREVVRYVDSCELVSIQHIHDVTIYSYSYDCAACGYRMRNTEPVHSCRGGQ